MVAQESFEAESFISGEKTPLNMEKIKFVLCFLGNFKCFQPMFLSSGLGASESPLVGLSVCLSVCQKNVKNVKKEVLKLFRVI